MPGRQVQDTGRGKRRIWLRLTLAALVVSLFGLVAVTALFAAEAERTLRHVALQAQLSVRLRDLQGVLVALVDAENGERGYLLTDDARMLAPYRAAVDRLPVLEKGLDVSSMTATDLDSSAADARLAIADRLAELAEAVRLQAAGQHAQALALSTSDKTLDDAAHARHAVNAVLDRVSEARDDLGRQVAKGASRIQRLLLLAVSSLVVFLLLAIGQTIRTLGLRTRFEQALGASEKRHRELVEDQSELVSLAREDGTLVYVNQAFARHFARTPAELVGTDRHDLFDAGERESMRMEGSAVLRTGRERHGENRMTGADGSERWVAWMNKRRQDPEGTLLHSVGRDITERKRAERALRASQAFLHRTSALAGIGGWELDLATGVAVWSEHVRRILEVDDDYVPSRADAVASYAPEARETVERAMADCVERGVAWDLELPRSTGSGRRIWVRTVGSLELERGQPRRIVGALQDITERKLLEQRLADGERFLHQVTDSLPVRIAYLDAHSRYRFVNLAHCRLYEKTRAEIIGRTHAQLADGRPNSQVDAHVAAVLRGTPQKFEYEEMQDGALRRIEAQLMPDVDAHGNARGFYSIGVDITERVANETQLRDLTQIIELSPDLILQSDHLGVVNYMNPALRRAIGIGPTEPPGGRRVGDFTTDETHRLYLREVQPALRTAGWWLGETTLTLADGRVTPVNHLVIAHREANGQVRRLSTVLRDISDQVAARNALQLQTATLRTVTEALPAMVAIVGKDGCYRFVNSAFERWTGLPREQLLGRRVADVIEPDDLATRQPWIDRVLAGESVSFETSDPTRPVKHLGVTYIPLHDADGGVDGYVGVAQDITPHKEETGRLMELTQRDALTGLLNRPGLERWLVQRDAEAAAGTLALLYVDLDHFKPVNDSFGHPAGDAVLREFALRLQGLVRPADAVARLGGDEFAVALAGVRERLPAQAIAEKIVAAAARPFIFAGIEIHVGASVGVAFQPDGAGGAQALVAYADDMLYKAKAAGRGTVA